jgi:hypothetical protein
MEQQVHLIYFSSDLAVFGEKITILRLSLHVNDNLKHINYAIMFSGFPLPIKLIPWYNLNIVEIGAKHHNPNPILIDTIQDLSNINGSPNHRSDRKSFEKYSLIVKWSSKYT